MKKLLILSAVALLSLVSVAHAQIYDKTIQISSFNYGLSTSDTTKPITVYGSGTTGVKAVLDTGVLVSVVTPTVVTPPTTGSPTPVVTPIGVTYGTSINNSLTGSTTQQFTFSFSMTAAKDPVYLQHNPYYVLATSTPNPAGIKVTSVVFYDNDTSGDSPYYFYIAPGQTKTFGAVYVASGLLSSGGTVQINAINYGNSTGNIQNSSITSSEISTKLKAILFGGVGGPVVPPNTSPEITVSNLSSSAGAPITTSAGAVVAQTALFHMIIAAGINPIYISSNPSNVFATSSTGFANLAAATIPYSGMNVYPRSMTGDKNTDGREGYYIIDPGTSREFTLFGSMDFKDVSLGTKTFQINAIRYGLNAWEVSSKSYTNNLQALKISVVAGNPGKVTTPFVSNASAQAINPTRVDGKAISQAVFFTYTLNAANDPLYISADPGVAVSYSTSGLPSQTGFVINGGNATPATMAGDKDTKSTSGYYFIPAGTSRTFNYAGGFDNTNGTTGTKSVQITAIKYGTSPSSLASNFITTGTEQMRISTILDANGKGSTGTTTAPSFTITAPNISQWVINTTQTIKWTPLAADFDMYDISIGNTEVDLSCDVRKGATTAVSYEYNLQTNSAYNPITCFTEFSGKTAAQLKGKYYVNIIAWKYVNNGKNVSLIARAKSNLFDIVTSTTQTSNGPIIIRSPKAGDSVKYGTSFNVNYSVNYNSDTLRVYLYNESTGLVYTSPTFKGRADDVLNYTSIATGSFLSNKLPSGKYYVKICDEKSVDKCGTSDSFYIVNQAATTVSDSACYQFAKYLAVGDTGADVIALQKFLISKGFLVLPAGTDPGYFGEATLAGVTSYQKSVGIIAEATTYPVGPYTIAKLNASCNGSVPGTTPAPSSSPTPTSTVTPILNPASLKISGQAGTSFNQVFVAENIPTNKKGAWSSWTVVKGDLPNGVSLRQFGAFSGLLSGTPTAAGTYNFMIQGYNPTDNLSAYSSISLTITSSATASPSPTAVPYTTSAPVPPSSPASAQSPAAALPDLIVSGITCTPTTITTTSSVYCSVAVYNNSSTAVNRSFNVSFQGVSVSIPYIGAREQKNSMVTSYAFRLSNAGTNNVTFIVDPENLVPEANETNNSYAQNFTVQSPTTSSSPSATPTPTPTPYSTTMPSSTPVPSSTPASTSYPSSSPSSISEGGPYHRGAAASALYSFGDWLDAIFGY